jgi:hypothetical protein
MLEVGGAVVPGRTLRELQDGVPTLLAQQLVVFKDRAPPMRTICSMIDHLLALSGGAVVSCVGDKCTYPSTDWLPAGYNPVQELLDANIMQVQISHPCSTHSCSAGHL